MAKPGPKPKPHLEVVREGNPGKRKRREGLKLDPAAPAEPDWREWFPVENELNELAIDDCRTAWKIIVGELDAAGALSEIDFLVLSDACVCWAMTLWCQRDIALNSIWTMGERGAQKNPSVTAANQFRTQLKFYVAELGLAPSSRSRLVGREQAGGDDEDPFDA